jgi:DNA mismatch repair protein MutH
MTVESSHVTGAFDHLKMMANLHHDKKNEDIYTAMQTYGLFLGMTEDAFEELTEQVVSFVPQRMRRASGWIIVGYLLGLTSAQRATQPQ